MSTTNTNPVMIDSFTADTTIGSANAPVTVSSIIMQGASSGDTAVFLEGPKFGTAEVFRLSNAANGASATWKPAIPFTFQNGLVYDQSASSLSANDYVYIFLI